MADRKVTVLNPAGYQEQIPDTDNIRAAATPTADLHAANKKFVDDEIATEEAARIAADNALQAAIDAEESARISADNTLQAAIDAEEAARIAADNTLQGNIDALETTVNAQGLQEVTDIDNNTTNSITISTNKITLASTGAITAVSLDADIDCGEY